MLHFMLMAPCHDDLKINYSLFVADFASYQPDRRLRKFYVQGIDIRLA